MYKAFFAWLLFFGPFLAHAEDFDFANYRSANLSQTAEGIPTSSEFGYVVAKDMLKFKSIVFFTGERRQTAKETAEVIARWGKAHGQSREFAHEFTHEVQVLDGDKKYWLPLQQDFVSAFDEEVPAGGKVEIYMLYLGMAGHNKVFVIDEFQSLSLGGSMDPNHPVMGSWRYVYPASRCAEVHTFKPTALEAFTSGNETGEIEFDIAKAPTKTGFYLVYDTVVSHNGKKDCSGGETPVGFKAALYFRIDQQKNELYMCGKQELKACLGPFVRVAGN